MGRNEKPKSANNAVYSGANDGTRTVDQPKDDSRPPERKDPTVIVPKTTKSLSDWTRAFSSGRWHSRTIAEASIKPKFQPIPSKVSVAQKCATSLPNNPTEDKAAP